MKLYLDFTPCTECKTMMSELSDPKMLLAHAAISPAEYAKFLRHLTYNHTEVVQAVMRDLPKQKKDQEFEFFK